MPDIDELIEDILDNRTSGTIDPAEFREMFTEALHKDAARYPEDAVERLKLMNSLGQDGVVFVPADPGQESGIIAQMTTPPVFIMHINPDDLQNPDFSPVTMALTEIRDNFIGRSLSAFDIDAERVRTPLNDLVGSVEQYDNIAAVIGNNDAFDISEAREMASLMEDAARMDLINTGEEITPENLETKIEAVENHMNSTRYFQEPLELVQSMAEQYRQSHAQQPTAQQTITPLQQLE